MSQHGRDHRFYFRHFVQFGLAALGAGVWLVYSGTDMLARGILGFLLLYLTFLSGAHLGVYVEKLRHWAADIEVEDD